MIIFHDGMPVVIYCAKIMADLDMKTRLYFLQANGQSIKNELCNCGKDRKISNKFAMKQMWVLSHRS